MMPCAISDFPQVSAHAAADRPTPPPAFRRAALRLAHAPRAQRPARQRLRAGGLRFLAGLLPLVSAIVLTSGCERGAAPSKAGTPQRVVVYTSVDEEFARRILDDFQRASGIAVDALYDTEGGKTTGFLRRIERESAAPRCDVWWSSEVYGTIELARAGLLAEYSPPPAADIPPLWKDAQRRWTGLAARARVLAFHPQRVRAEKLPQTWRELATEPWCRRLAIANPRFGTTRGHVAALFAYWGDAPAAAFVQTLRKAGARLADGNGHAVRLVAAGAADVCMTDTDDVWVAQRRGESIELIYPAIDRGAPVMWIPCTVALLRGAPHEAAGKQLVDYLASAAAERALAASDSRNVPVRPALREELALPGPAPEPHDFERVADALPTSDQVVTEELLR